MSRIALPLRAACPFLICQMQPTRNGTPHDQLAGALSPQKDERRLIELAARQAHLQVGTWMRQACLRAAEREAGGDERRARLLDFIRRARAGEIPPAAQHAVL